MPSMDFFQGNKYSRLALLVVVLIISIYRLGNVKEKEISWDIFGYYLPLPATFIYEDPLLNDRAWVEKLNEEKQLTGTLYQISSNDDGEPMYFFFLGMAMLFLPFFLLAHGWASLFGFPADGFSGPYQYFMVFGAVVYTIIGLYFFRKILLKYFDDKLSTVLLLLIVFATNYIHHLTLKDLETVNVLFMLVNIIIWHTIKWHETQKLKDLLILGVSTVFIGLVKPSEVVILLIPILWGMSTIKDIKEKWKLVWVNGRSFLIMIAVGLLVALPQITYWLIKTGKPLYDSYKNPGVGLDLLNPHFMEAMFSYRKGWLIYTPLMICSLVGFYFLYKKNRNAFIPLFAYFLLTFYVIISWTEWFYGSAFSNRPLITTYPILAITLGYFILEVKKRKWQIALFSVFAILCLGLNQFQWWQLKNRILDPRLTTKEYYWASFLETSYDLEWEQLKLVKRPFGGMYEFKKVDEYDLKETIYFDLDLSGVEKSTSLESYMTLKPEDQFFPGYQKRISEITDKDHTWMDLKVDIRLKENLQKNRMPFLVFTMEFEGKPYAYYAPEIKQKGEVGIWNTYWLQYLSPEPRSINDEFKCYIWNADGNSFDIDNFELNIYERKPLKERLKK